MDYYYLDRTAKPAGPVSQEVLLQLHQAAEKVDDYTLVVPVGGDQWKPLFQVFNKAPKGVRSPAGVGLQNPAPVPAKRTFLLLLVLALLIVGLAIGLVVLALGKAGGVSSLTSPPKKDPALPAAQVHPLAEWYDLGVHLGKEAKVAYHDFGMEVQGERGHIAHLLKNLGVEIGQVSAEAITLCWEGYQDGISGHPTRWVVSPDQQESILPLQAQGYITFEKLEEPLPLKR